MTDVKQKALAALTLVISVSLAGGQGLAAGPDTPVASDGSAGSEAGGSDARFSAPFRGSGPDAGLALDERFAKPGTARRDPLEDNNRRTVIGADGRFRVNATADYPYSAIAEISFDDERGRQFGCTGWFISKDTIATAGHCVHQGEGGVDGFYDPATYRIWPGRNGAATPFGKCGARRLYTVTGWSVDGKVSSDYGAIKLDCNKGKETGWFGYFYTDKSLANRAIGIFGYPCDKPLHQMWGMNGSVASATATSVKYTIDTFGCQSGSPVYETRNDGPYGMAIHTYGVSNGTNSGTRITKQVFDNLEKWAAAR
jgi:glutamyl endopeptidase